MFIWVAKIWLMLAIFLPPLQRFDKAVFCREAAASKRWLSYYLNRSSLVALGFAGAISARASPQKAFEPGKFCPFDRMIMVA